MPDCIFCKIVAREIPSNIVYQDERVTAFRDTNPQMPVYTLIVPNVHIANTEEIEPDQAEAVGALLVAAREVARRVTAALRYPELTAKGSGAEEWSSAPGAGRPRRRAA
jgi:histidine triad (HIT) family protein